MGLERDQIRLGALSRRWWRGAPWIRVGLELESTYKIHRTYVRGWVEVQDSGKFSQNLLAAKSAVEFFSEILV